MVVELVTERKIDRGKVSKRQRVQVVFVLAADVADLRAGLPAAGRPFERGDGDVLGRLREAFAFELR